MNPKNAACFDERIYSGMRRFILGWRSGNH